MAEETTQPTQGDQQQVQLLLDESQMKTSFANAYRIHTTAEEVVHGLRVQHAQPQPPGRRQQLLFRVTDRVVLSYPNVKRLSMSLAQLVQQYEQRIGEIPINPRQPRAATSR